MADSDSSDEPPFALTTSFPPQSSIVSRAKTDASVASSSFPVDIEDPESDSGSDGEAPASIMFEGIASGSTMPLLPHRQLPVGGNRRVDGLRHASRTLDGRPRNRIVPLATNSHSSNIQSWTDVSHLDQFLSRLYVYYLNKGLTCILLSSICHLATGAFVICISTFLSSCIDYSRFHSSKSLSAVLVDDCYSSMSLLSFLFLLVFCVFWAAQFVRLVADVSRQREMQHFMNAVLGISDEQLQTVSWSEIVNRIVQTRLEHQPSNGVRLKKLDAHAIANRILRKDNYLIAMFNKGIVDVSLPFYPRRQIMSKLIEWNLSYCVFSFVFDDNGLFLRRFLKESNRNTLIKGLRKRFRMMAIINLVCSPFLFCFLLFYSMFKYAEEYQKNPSGLADRQYSPFAWWKFREFNELPHLVRIRLNRSVDNANMYIRQFPNQAAIIVAKFVSFVSGSLAAILLVVTLFEEEMQQGFEITDGRSAFFYIGLFGALMALSRGLVPPESQVFDPTYWLKEVSLDTHYLPDEWRNKAHTSQVRTEFEHYYDYKIVLWGQELLSVIFAPIILYYSLPSCAPAIIDFFREFTVHVDTYGYVCSFAVFDFKRHGNLKFGAAQELISENRLSNQGKMEHSFLSFKATYPQWDPGLEGSEYLNRVLARRRDRLGMSVRHQPPSSATSSPETRRHVSNDHATHQPHMSGSRYDIAASSGAVNTDDAIESYLRGESTMMASRINPQTVGRELIGLVDAFFESSRNV